MNRWVIGILGIGGVATLLQLLENKASAKPKPKGCRIPTNQAIFQANQAFMTNDPQFVQAVMTIFDDYGCHAEAQAMRDYLATNGFKPNVPIIPTSVPMGAPGQVVLQPGEVWRAAALLGGIGCAVGLQTIKSGVEGKGFANVYVSSKNPGWGKAWDADEGFLECTRYIQATVVGKPRAEKKPSQVYRIERVSSVA